METLFYRVATQAVDCAVALLSSLQKFCNEVDVSGVLVDKSGLVAAINRRFPALTDATSASGTQLTYGR